MSVSINNVVSINISKAFSGINQANLSTIALFSHEPTNNNDIYRIYNDSLSVATDYGSNSVTYQMANAIFSQPKNILNNNGYLIVIPLNSAVSATQGSFTTANLTTNLINIKAVTSGDIRIVVNGINVDLVGINFSKINTLSDLAQLFQNNLPNVIVSHDTTALTFTSKLVGTDSSIDIVQLPGGLNTNMATATLLNVAGGSDVVGQNSQGETIVNAITRTKDLVYYANILTTMDLEDSAISTISSAIEGLASTDEKIFGYCFSDYSYFETTGLPYVIATANQNHTRCLGYTINLLSAKLFLSSYFSIYLSDVNPTSSTMHMQKIVNLNADSNINQTLLNKAKNVGLDVYVGYTNTNYGSVYSNGLNDYADNVRDIRRVKFAIQINVFNVLATAGTKISQTDVGVSQITNAIKSILNSFSGTSDVIIGVNNQWNSSQTFGNKANFLRNIYDNGYYVYATPVTQQSQADRAARKSPPIQIAFKLTGAIQSVNIIGIVEV